MKRRTFLETTSLAAMGALLSTPFSSFAQPSAKKRIAMVGTGSRGTGFWGETVQKNFSDLIEFVGLCDLNQGRAEYAKKRIGVTCPTFTNFEEMLRKVKPEVVIVTTMDSQHDTQIVKALEMGCDVITEKPMTTDEIKCKAILDAEKKTGRKVVVAFNYRHSPHMTKIKELLSKDRVGAITSVDFHWYLNVHHGSDYFRRWHGLKKNGGSLWVHKATHHFDLLNWWVDSDPVEVMAYGSLENYGKANPFRGPRCMTCPLKDKCKYYYDITKNQTYMEMYVANEKYDGYVRDQCVFREEIDIWDKMSAQIVYANGIVANYSLTTYNPYEGWRITFNGKDGKIDSWQDIPYQAGKIEQVDQAQRHAMEMTQTKDEQAEGFEEIIVAENFKQGFESVKVPKLKGGHGGGDARMQNLIFRNTTAPDPLKHMAGTRDGAMSLLIGVAARKSIAEKRPVKISELTDIKPAAKRPV